MRFTTLILLARHLLGLFLLLKQTNTELGLLVLCLLAEGQHEAGRLLLLFYLFLQVLGLWLRHEDLASTTAGHLVLLLPADTV